MPPLDPKRAILLRRARFIAAAASGIATFATATALAAEDDAGTADASADIDANVDASNDPDAGTTTPQPCLCAAAPIGSSDPENVGVVGAALVGALVVARRRRVK